MNDNLHPGTTNAHIEAAFGGDAPKCRECEEEMSQHDSLTYYCENEGCGAHGDLVDVDDAYPDPYDEGY
jgi:hypothetical protein